CNPGLLKKENNGNFLLRLAARNDRVEIVESLVQYGVDVNSPDDERTPEGPINEAARNGAVNVVRWMLDNGAKINQLVNGHVRCFPLSGAARNGHLEVVKLLLDHGADINATWADNNALSFAIMYD